MTRALRLAWIWTLVTVLAGCGDNSAYLPPPRPPSDDDEELMAQLAAVQAARAKSDQAKGAPNAKPSPGTTTVSTTPNLSAAPGSTPPVVAPAGTAGTGGTGANTAPVAAASPIEQTMSELTRRERTIAKLRRIAQALESYRQNNGCYPPPATGSGTVSWRVLLLPSLGRRDLYEKFRLHEPWDSEHNRRLLAEIPDDFRSLERTDDKTSFLLVRGPKAAFEAADELTEEECTDGFENTLLVVEASQSRARPWTQPDDLVVNSETLRDDLFSLRQDCCFAIFGGAAGVRRISADIPADRLNALLTRSGGEPVRFQDVTAYAHPEIDRALIEKLKDEGTVIAAAPIPATNAGTPTPAPASPLPGATASPNTASSTTANPVATNVSPTTPARSRSTPSASVLSETPAAQQRRRDVPPDDQVEAASNLVRDLYGDDFAKAKTREQRREFAKKMLDESAKVGEDDAGLYVLLRAARDISSKAGDLTTALDATDRMSAQFTIDALAAKLTLLEQAITNQDDDSHLDAIHDNGLKLGDEAVQADRFDEAQRLYRLALSAVRRGMKIDHRLGSRTAARRANGTDDRETTLQERETHLQDAKRAYAKISDRIHLLLRDPDNRSANAAVGRYFCLSKEDWIRGLPLLARGDDDALQALAALELANPAGPNEQADLADRWWAWSEKTTVDLERATARRHAKQWYEQALPQLPPSLQKVRIEKRVADTSSLTTSR